MDISVSETEVLAEMQRTFPHETRIAVLTVTNRKLVDKANALEEVIQNQRAEANEDAWRQVEAEGNKRA